MSVEVELTISAVILISLVVGALVVMWLVTEGMIWLIIQLARAWRRG